MYARNNAVGMANVFYFEKVKRLWLANSENYRGISVREQFGRPAVHKGPNTAFEKDGVPIQKNTKVGEIIIRYSDGKHEVVTPKGLQIITILNKTFYAPADAPRYACDLTINLNEGKPRYYRDI